MTIIYNNYDLEAAHVSISRGMDKKAVVHLHSGILLSRSCPGQCGSVGVLSHKPKGRGFDFQLGYMNGCGFGTPLCHI